MRRFLMTIALPAVVACSSSDSPGTSSLAPTSGMATTTSGSASSGQGTSGSLAPTGASGETGSRAGASGDTEVPIGLDAGEAADGSRAPNASMDTSDTAPPTSADDADSHPDVTVPDASSPLPANDAGGGPAPANPNASAGVKSVLRYLKSMEGKKVVTGQLGWWHQTWCNNPDPSLWPFVVQETGHTPAIYGGEFWTTDVPSEIPKLVSMWNAHSLITIQWHAPNPAIAGSTAWTTSSPGLSASQWHDIVTPGTSLYNTWLAEIDVIAGYLKQLQSAGVTVMWRPFHESHGGWFWWGTGNRPAGAFQALYQMMFNRFTTYHGLNNLTWNWSTGGTSIQSMYPGDNYVDMISMDAYGGPLPQNQYEAMLPFGKLVAWGEWGLDNSQTYVTPTWLLANQPKVVYVMQWYGTCTSGTASASSYKPFFMDSNGVDSPVSLP